MEELSEQTLSSLSVIHRFMSAHSNIGQSGVDVHSLPEMKLDSSTFRRMRHTSEHSEIYSEMSDNCGGSGGVGGSGGGGGGGGSGGGGGTFMRAVSNNLTLLPFSNVRRKGPVRSMTEVRPSITSESFLTCDITPRRLKEDSKEPTNESSVAGDQDHDHDHDRSGDSKTSSVVTDDGEKTLLAAPQVSKRFRLVRRQLDRSY